MAKASDLAGAAQVQEQALGMDQIWGKRITIGGLIKMVGGNFNGRATKSALVAIQIEDSKEVHSAFIGGRLGQVMDDYYTNGPGKTGEPIEDVTLWLSPKVGDVSYNGWTMLDSDVTPDDWGIPEKQLKQMMLEKANKENVMPI